MELSAPDRFQIKKFSQHPPNWELTANEIILTAVCTIGIFRTRGDRAPADIATEPHQGNISQLITTLVLMNDKFFVKIGEETLPIVPAIAFLAQKMGAWVEHMKPFRTPWGEEHCSFSSRWVVNYRAWNHCRSYDIKKNIEFFDASLFSLTKSLEDVLVAFAFDDLAIPMELGEALTLAFALNQAQLSDEK